MKHYSEYFCILGEGLNWTGLIILWVRETLSFKTELWFFSWLAAAVWSRLFLEPSHRAFSISGLCGGLELHSQLLWLSSSLVCPVAWEMCHPPLSHEPVTYIPYNVCIYEFLLGQTFLIFMRFIFCEPLVGMDLKKCTK